MVWSERVCHMCMTIANRNARHKSAVEILLDDRVRCRFRYTRYMHAVTNLHARVYMCYVCVFVHKYSLGLKLSASTKYQLYSTFKKMQGSNQICRKTE